MKSRSSFVYLGVAVVSLLFAALQPAHQTALDQSLVDVAHKGWTVPWSDDKNSSGTR